MDNSKENIITKGLIMFLERGYDGFSMRDLSDVVGVKQPSVYYHFKNKRALFGACAKRFFDKWYVWLDEISIYQSDLHQFIHQTCASFGRAQELVTQLYGAHTITGPYRLLLDIAKYSSETLQDMQQFNDRYFVILAQLVASAKQAGQIRSDISAQSIYVTLASLLEGSSILSITDQKLEPKQEAENMFRIIWRGIALHGSGDETDAGHRSDKKAEAVAISEKTRSF
jgi:AcrR family transcriptional regulator